MKYLDLTYSLELKSLLLSQLTEAIQILHRKQIS